MSVAIKIKNPVIETISVASVATVIGFVTYEILREAMGTERQRTKEERIAALGAGFITAVVIHTIVKNYILKK